LFVAFLAVVLDAERSFPIMACATRKTVLHLLHCRFVMFFPREIERGVALRARWAKLAYVRIMAEDHIAGILSLKGDVSAADSGDSAGR
jgi:hypothetical protein